MQIKLRESNFEEVRDIWINHLWPKRMSPVKAISPISINLKYDATIEKSIAHFFVAETQNREIIGVISGYRTEETLFRSRGLFVFPIYRRLGISQKLLRIIKERAISENCTRIWTLPRKTAWPAYKKFGFVRTSEWHTQGMEFGPNCIAICNLLKK